MSTLHVRNVPKNLYMRLKQRAEAQRRSLSAEVITLLEWAIKEANRSFNVHNPEVSGSQ